MCIRDSLLYRELESLARGGNPDLHEAGDPAEAAIAKLLCRLCGPTIFFDASPVSYTHLKREHERR